MKVKCPSCGKKEAEILSKMEIKNREDLVREGFSPEIASKVISLLIDIFAPRFLVCRSCGHMEEV